MPPTNIACPSSTTTFKIRDKKSQLREQKRQKNLNSENKKGKKVSPWSCRPDCGCHWTGWWCPPTGREHSRCSPGFVSFQFFIKFSHLRRVTMLTSSPSWPACVNRLTLQDKQGKQSEPGGGDQAPPWQHPPAQCLKHLSDLLYVESINNQDQWSWSTTFSLFPPLFTSKVKTQCFKSFSPRLWLRNPPRFVQVVSGWVQTESEKKYFLEIHPFGGWKMDGDGGTFINVLMLFAWWSNPDESHEQ